MTYVAADDRYERMPYRRCGRSGLQLPADLARPLAQLRRRPAARQPARDPAPRLRPRRHPLRPRQQLRAARTARPRRTSAALLRQDFRPYRDELIISTKAGYDMWPGPYGEWGSRKYLLASLDQSLRAHGARLRRHLLLAPLRPRHAARGDDGRAGRRRCSRARRCTSASRPTRRTRPREAARDPARHGRAAAHPPALVLDAQPLDRGRPARRAGAGGHRLHRLLAAGAGPAHATSTSTASRRAVAREREPLPAPRTC